MKSGFENRLVPRRSRSRIVEPDQDYLRSFGVSTEIDSYSRVKSTHWSSTPGTPPRYLAGHLRRPTESPQLRRGLNRNVRLPPDPRRTGIELIEAPLGI